MAEPEAHLANTREGVPLTQRKPPRRPPQEAKNLLQRIAELEAQHAQMASALEEARERQARDRQSFNAELEQFSFVASHDLQEPLRKIQTFGSLLNKAKSGLDEKERDYLRRMQEATRRMQAMIEDLLTFSRVTTRAQPFEPVDLTGVARLVTAELKTQIERTGGRVEVGDLPTVEADPAQMHQLLWNLIDNGLKFHRAETPPVVKVYGRVLKNGAEGPPPEGERCQIFVEDNGIGFEAKFADHIFGIFQRLNGHSAYEGTGIGLAVCRKIAERHGGGITVKSTPGQNTTFTSTLPLCQPREENPSKV